MPITLAGTTSLERACSENLNCRYQNGRQWPYLCGHARLCAECHASVMQRNKRCPVCREPIDVVKGGRRRRRRRRRVY